MYRDTGESLAKDEIWLKVGGDSFKFGLQVVNRQSPNAAEHTTVIACLEADDNLPNLHVCLDQYRDTVRELQGMKWRWEMFNPVINI